MGPCRPQDGVCSHPAAAGDTGMPCQLLQGGTGASLPQRPIPSSGCCLLLAAGAFDRNDLLFMRQEEDKRRFAEIEQEEQERLAVSWQGVTMQPASSCVGRPACKLLRMGSHGCEIAAALMEQQRLLWRAARLAYKPCNPFLRCGLLCTYPVLALPYVSCSSWLRGQRQRRRKRRGDWRPSRRQLQRMQRAGGGKRRIGAYTCHRQFCWSNRCHQDSVIC